MGEINALDALLAADLNVEEQVFMKRLNAYFTVKAIDGETLTQLREAASHFEGRGAKRRKVIDENKLAAAVIAAACVSPDFRAKPLMEKHGAKTVDECVQKALFAGEIVKLQQTILELSGFDDEDDEKIEEVKN
ncbi:phage tail assembly chaperone [Brevibacillus daliensis]|uniref:phage tail assembly chaperone n=1 Tax=Brevibacillus daliensis TaxID=2892995 RepID=UPI001E47554D|nr:hypothetical protein [Brevibacillus daliensis]